MKNTNWIIICISTLFVVFLWFYCWHYIDHLFPVSSETHLADRGTFGDKFGFVNSLFSGLALTGIVISIYFQQRELSLQREELAATREEFKDQNFQTTFFNLLKTQRQIIDEIECSFRSLISYDNEQSEEIKGRVFFLKSKLEMHELLKVIQEKRYFSYFKWKDEHDFPLFYT